MVVRVFCANAGLDRVAVALNLVLTQRQGFTRGHAQLPLHQIQARHRFGDRVLNLQPGVHLHEIKTHGLGLVVSHLLHDELHRACPDIIHRLGCSHRCRPHALAQILTQAWRRRLLQHLLMATLHRAIALVQMHHLAVAVPKHLDFYVARALHVFLDQHRIIAKAVAGFALA